MKKYLLMFCILLLSVGVAYGQLEQVVNTFDAASADTNYWNWFDHVGNDATIGGHYSISDNADPDTGWVKMSYVSDPTPIGSGAMQLEYSVHNTEGWGGYSNIRHWHPDTNSVYDWSAYDSISFWYYNSVPQSLPGRVELRLNLHDVSNSPDGNATYNTGQCEYYYSFYHILDDAPGWNEIKLPLVSNDSWDGNGFNLTGWAGINGNATLDRDKIKGFTIEFSISGSGAGDFSSGTIVLDHLALKGAKATPFVLFNGKTLSSKLSIFTWGQSTLEIEEGAGATEGTNALKWVQGNEWNNGWSGAGFGIDPPENMFLSWGSDSIKCKIKADEGTGAIRFQFEDGAAKRGKVFTPVGGDGAWHYYAFKLTDFEYMDGTSNFDSTAVSVFQVMGEGTAVAGKTIYIDDL
ncbi:MAG: hypothetical protein L6422_02200, partial [Candidatus Marinimicrobia bacterium]|nr:hypothetical protein [bacterium]MCG2715095.1 hypothetical protein [Candidatus Neomarinimicrobiota bacterium]